MMKLMFIFMVLFSLTSWAGGGYVGNGGDAIKCRKDSAANRLEGYYALDYIATLPTLTGDDGLRAVGSWDDSSKRLLSLLRNKAPSLAQSFEHFVKLMYNKSYAQDRVWEASPFGLIQLIDEKLTSLIPSNCVEGASPQIIQAVIRLYEPFAGTQPGHIVYKYDPALLSELDKKAPLQLSFLLVHEWLWDLSSNVERNRRVNRFLHSVEAEGMTAADFIAELKGMGLQIPDLQSDEFAAESCQGYPITREEFDQAYPNLVAMVNWGAAKISRRQRIVQCDSIHPNCDLGWKPPRFDQNTLTQDAYFLGVVFDTDRSAPLKIISSQHIVRTGGHVGYKSGEIACSFKTDGEFNIECSVRDPDLVYPLYGKLGSPDNFTRAPVMKGLLTHECFRLRAIGSDYTSIMGNGPMRQEFTEIETVISARSVRGEFLPR